MSEIYNENAWYVIAYSHEVKPSQVLSRVVLEKELVVYRGSSGKITVAVDRCPHKSVSLSMGKVEGDNIKCLYHGWGFSSDGILVDIPNAPDDMRLPKCKLKLYETIEQDGLIWSWMNLDTKPDQKPRMFPMDSKYKWVNFNNVMKASMDLILENGLDCAHTGFVHDGLFRGIPKDHVEAEIRKNETGLTVQTFGEKAQGEGSRFSWGKKNEDVFHTDEFIVPHTVYVDYKASGNEMITVLFCTPISGNKTRAFTRMGIYWKRFSFFIMPISIMIIKKIIKQDKAVLENQQSQLDKTGNKRNFVFAQTDKATQLFFRCFKNFHTNKPLWRADEESEMVRYKL